MFLKHVLKRDPDGEPSATPLVDYSALPVELRGKTTVEIAAFYNRREEILKDQMDRMQRTPPAAEKPKAEAKKVEFDIFNDAEGSVDRKVSERVTEALGNATAHVAPAVIAANKLGMSNDHKDWAKFSKEVEKRMAGFTAESQMNPAFWESTYLLVKGENADRMVEEAVNSARNPTERPTPPGQAPPSPRALDDDEKTVARKFGMSAEKYRTASDRLDSDRGSLPMTLDNMTTPKRKAS